MLFEGKGWLAAGMIVVAAVAGCTSSRYRVVPGQVGVQVEAPEVHCGEQPRDIRVKVRIRNDSAGVLRITIDNPPGPPYKLSWLSYDVLDDAGNLDLDHDPGGHGPLPQPTLKMDPGDRTVLFAVLYDINEDDYARSFRFRIEDDDKHVWTTDAFRPCVARGAVIA
ncbi:hypothetical protein LVB87_03285 [Lysobacter sp. KIS68-7]|uniref:hypothetical protein n=1 Tax=Lysobacter sp. KIS68-7 TaxID=2904252 RepID=UPI001E61F3AA|nr:hypothetical protein [Lysobacter sp. KIS68-7]UHQ20200.1 hypothetical protein LVB87_03285 [Lysobacter sp. KIS68-7]